jgi:hypothetical protein
MHEAVILGEAVAGRAVEVRRKLLMLNSGVNVSLLDVAELLYEAQNNHYLNKWGFESLPDYAAKELGMKPRKAQYLARIIKVCTAVGLKREQYNSAKISKLKEIARLEPEGEYWNYIDKVKEPLDEHIVRLVLDSDNMTVPQIKQEVARLMGHVGLNARVVRSYSTDLSSWENVIKRALERARKHLGSKGRDEDGKAKEYSEGECYECICATFNADPNFDEDPGDLTMAEVLENAPQLPMEEF